MAHVVELIHYPVKGCAGISPGEAMVTPAGLAYDRSFMVVSEAGVFRTQRRDPRLALIRPEIRAGGERLVLRTPGFEAVQVDVDTSGARRPVDLFGNPYRGIDQGDTAAAWLSDVLRAPSRLVRVPPEHDRVTDGRTPGTSGYADSCALHILARSTLDLLNAKVAEQGGSPLPMDRFRPNVVGGWDEPHTTVPTASPSATPNWATPSSPSAAPSPWSTRKPGPGTARNRCARSPDTAGRPTAESRSERGSRSCGPAR